MSGYVVSQGGTFGVLARQYTDGAGELCYVIRWGPLGVITPVRAADCKRLASSYYVDARAEAVAWLSAADGSVN